MLQKRPIVGRYSENPVSRSISTAKVGAFSGRLAGGYGLCAPPKSTNDRTKSYNEISGMPSAMDTSGQADMYAEALRQAGERCGYIKFNPLYDELAAQTDPDGWPEAKPAIMEPEDVRPWYLGKVGVGRATQLVL